jgi:hypothetical protein
MLRCLNSFSVRDILVLLAIFIYILIDSLLCLVNLCAAFCFGYRPLPRDYWIKEVVIHIYKNLFLVALGSLPLFTLFLLRHPSFWHVLIHVVATFYPFWILITMALASFPVECHAGDVLWVVSWATFLAGLPEAMAAGRWARLVYYAVLLFWLSLIVAPLVAKLLS